MPRRQDLDHKLALALILVRRIKGWRQRDLAAGAGVRLGSVKTIEQGRRLRLPQRQAEVVRALDAAVGLGPGGLDAVAAQLRGLRGGLGAAGGLGPVGGAGGLAAGGDGGPEGGGGGRTPAGGAGGPADGGGGGTVDEGAEGMLPGAGRLAGATIGVRIGASIGAGELRRGILAVVLTSGGGGRERERGDDGEAREPFGRRSAADRRDLGLALGLLRRLRGLSREEVAAAAGARGDSIRAIESGRRRPGQRTAAPIAAALRIDSRTVDQVAAWIGELRGAIGRGQAGRAADLRAPVGVHAPARVHALPGLHPGPAAVAGAGLGANIIAVVVGGSEASG
jgi:transcriptional regulator with XRE-family HTH domain